MYSCKAPNLLLSVTVEFLKTNNTVYLFFYCGYCLSPSLGCKCHVLGGLEQQIRTVSHTALGRSLKSSCWQGHTSSEAFGGGLPCRFLVSGALPSVFGVPCLGAVQLQFLCCGRLPVCLCLKSIFL